MEDEPGGEARRLGAPGLLGREHRGCGRAHAAAASRIALSISVSFAEPGGVTKRGCRGQMTIARGPGLRPADICRPRTSSRLGEPAGSGGGTTGAASSPPSCRTPGRSSILTASVRALRSMPFPLAYDGSAADARRCSEEHLPTGSVRAMGRDQDRGACLRFSCGALAVVLARRRAGSRPAMPRRAAVACA